MLNMDLRAQSSVFYPPKICSFISPFRHSLLSAAHSLTKVQEFLPKTQQLALLNTKHNLKHSKPLLLLTVIPPAHLSSWSSIYPSHTSSPPGRAPSWGPWCCCLPRPSPLSHPSKRLFWATQLVAFRCTR